MIASAVKRVLGGGDGRSPAEVDGDIREEFAFHLAMLERDLREEGLAPGAARAESERRFGDIPALHRRCRAEALKERIMLQKVTIGLLVLISVGLLWGLILTTQRARAAREMAEAMRAQSQAAREHAVEAERKARESETAARAAAEKPGQVYLEGIVGRPGTFSFAPGLTLRRLMASAGGTSAQIRRITVTNSDGKGGQTVRFTLSGEDYLKAADGPDVELKANDLIRVE